MLDTIVENDTTAYPWEIGEFKQVNKARGRIATPLLASRS